MKSFNSTPPPNRPKQQPNKKKAADGKRHLTVTKLRDKKIQPLHFQPASAQEQLGPKMAMNAPQLLVGSQKEVNEEDGFAKNNVREN